MKKILIFSTAYFPLAGGAEVAVRQITDRLPDFEFDMITARMDAQSPRSERIGNINVYRIGLGIQLLDKYLLALAGHLWAAKLHRSRQYDSIWAIMASFGGFAALSLKKKYPQLPFLLTLQEGDDPEHIKKRVGLMAGRFYQIFFRADHIQCISSYLARWARQNGAAGPITVVGNGVDVDKFSIFDFRFSNKEQTRSRLGISENDKVIITTSRLVKKNGVADLVKGFSLLSSQDSNLKINNFKLLIVGSGPEESSLRRLVADLGLENRVIFAGYVDYDDLPRYLWASDIFCRPSLSEGLGNSFIEAMAAGLPVIGTPVGGIPDFLADGATGWVCRVNDPESIAGKIIDIIDDGKKDQVAKVLENARQLVNERYQWQNIADQMRKIFTTISK